MIEHQKRWDVFREKREKMQDLYSDLKKKQAFAEMHAKTIF